MSEINFENYLKLNEALEDEKERLAQELFENALSNSDTVSELIMNLKLYQNDENRNQIVRLARRIADRHIGGINLQRWKRWTKYNLVTI